MAVNLMSRIMGGWRRTGISAEGLAAAARPVRRAGWLKWMLTNSLYGAAIR